MSGRFSYSNSAGTKEPERSFAILGHSSMVAIAGQHERETVRDRLVVIGLRSDSKPRAYKDRIRKRAACVAIEPTAPDKELVPPHRPQRARLSTNSHRSPLKVKYFQLVASWLARCVTVWHALCIDSHRGVPTPSKQALTFLTD